MFFEQELAARIKEIQENEGLNGCASTFMLSTLQAKYSYNFRWMGRPIIQYPQDMVAMQELIWAVKPDLIIETGIAHGGSL
ncbi:MAG: cephalosporin hydroxylase, partial [Methanobacteriota archaeon]